MTLEPRVSDLLARYPLDLSDAEFAELAAAAEGDPRIEEVMDELLRLDARLTAAPDPADLELTQQGRARLDELLSRFAEAQTWSADGATPAAKDSTEAKAWSADGATPAAKDSTEAQSWSADGATPAAKRTDDLESSSAHEAQLATTADIVDLASVRRRRFSPPALLAIAALVLIGAVLALQSGPVEPEFVPRGEFIDLEGVLWVMGEARVEDGAARLVSDPVTFRGVLNGGSVSLVLLETQAGTTHVLHPAPGGVWEGVSGTNLLVTETGTQAYRPARPGPAEYHLVAAPTPPEIDSGPVASVDEFLQSCGGRVLDRSVIEWKDGASEEE